MDTRSISEVRMTWAQFVWGVATIALLTGAWFDLRSQVARTLEVLESQDRRIAAIEAREARSGFTDDDARKLRDEIVRALRR